MDGRVSKCCDALSVYEEELDRFAKDSLKLTKLCDILLRINPTLCSENEKQLILNKLNLWTTKLSELVIPSDMTIRDWLLSSGSEKSLSMSPTILSNNTEININEDSRGSSGYGAVMESSPCSNSPTTFPQSVNCLDTFSEALTIVDGEDISAESGIEDQQQPANFFTFCRVVPDRFDGTAMLESADVPSLSNGAPGLYKMFWRMKVMWPHWARQDQIPTLDCPITSKQWCFFCSAHDDHSDSDQPMEMTAVVQHLMDHYLCLSHFNNCKRLCRVHKLQAGKTPTGRFFLNQDASNLSVQLAVNNDSKRLNPIVRSRIADFQVENRKTNVGSFYLRNETSEDMLLRFEGCAHSLGDHVTWFSVADKNSITLQSSTATLKATEYFIAPGAVEVFDFAMNITGELPYNVSLCMFFLFATKNDIGVDGKSVLAKPRVFVVDYTP